MSSRQRQLCREQAERDAAQQALNARMQMQFARAQAMSEAANAARRAAREAELSEEDAAAAVRHASNVAEARFDDGSAAAAAAAPMPENPSVLRKRLFEQLRTTRKARRLRQRQQAAQDKGPEFVRALAEEEEQRRVREAARQARAASRAASRAAAVQRRADEAVLGPNWGPTSYAARLAALDDFTERWVDAIESRPLSSCAFFSLLRVTKYRTRSLASAKPAETRSKSERAPLSSNEHGASG